MGNLPISHNYISPVRFKGKRNRNHRELYSLITVFLTARLLSEFVVAAVLWLTFFKESRDDFLYVFRRNLDFLFVFLLFLVEKLFKARAYIADFSLIVSNAYQRGFPHFVLSDVSHKKEFLANQTDSPLKLEQNWHNISELILAEKQSFVSIYSLVLVFKKFE